MKRRSKIFFLSFILWTATDRECNAFKYRKDPAQSQPYKPKIPQKPPSSKNAPEERLRRPWLPSSMLSISVAALHTLAMVILYHAPLGHYPFERHSESRMLVSSKSPKRPPNFGTFSVTSSRLWRGCGGRLPPNVEDRQCYTSDLPICTLVSIPIPRGLK